ncbi:hypothetical protein RJ639_044735 [Escallonia herrerae]|uniref:RNA polymerase sigma-70 domain-containing protein n=1 Tax=Escallonia herrerae TaxID=1293975 RepID=A0AA88WA31_9ASTE|nr:hypothetical protein RJ639_044735 [Escallonia herrerae]
MAITLCSSSSHSPTLPTIPLPSSLASKSSLKPTSTGHQPLPTSRTFSKLTSSNLASDDNLTLNVTAAEAMALASVTSQVARDAMVTAFELENELQREWRSGLGVRRKKRRRRRKEEARVEAVRERILQTSEHEPTSNQWAEAAGMSSSSLDWILCNGRESRERINRCYRRLVVSVAASYQGKGLSLQDLIQEGSMGLLRGAKMFDPERGYKLSTYVYWWIRQAVAKAIADKSRTIRLPGSICELVPRIVEANNSLTKRFRRLPSHDEIAEAVDMNVATVRLVCQRTRPLISLDEAVTNRGGMRLQEIIQGPDDTTPELIVKRQQMKQELDKVVNLLSDREARILRLHYGLDGETPRSYEEIGKLLKLSRERVRQINRTAMSKLQQSSLVDNLKVYMF